MKVILVILLIMLVACGLQRVNAPEFTPGILVLTKNEKGEQVWVCVSLASGGSPYLATWNPDKDGKCYKEN